MKSKAISQTETGQSIKEKAPKASLASFIKRWETILVFLIILVIFINTRLSPYFLNINNLSRTIPDFMEIGLMMLPLSFIIITGNMDLSIASNMGMSASFMGVLHNMGVNIWVAALCGLLLGTLGGVLNGYLVAKVKLHSMVVTLGTYAFFRGLAYGFLGDQAARNYPASFTYLGQGKIFGTPIPFSVALFLILAIIFGIILHKTTFGRQLFAIGNNEEAARYSGVPVARVKLTIFILSGFISALAGLVLAARFGSTRPDNGTGLETAVITASVLGGLDIMGGKGTMYGAALALALIGLLRFGMGLMNIQSQVQSMVIGVLLIISILLPYIGSNLGGLKKFKIQLKPLLTFLGIAAIFVAFLVFFMWSRGIVLSGV